MFEFIIESILSALVELSVFLGFKKVYVFFKKIFSNIKSKFKQN